jgi:hypothetical protein
LERKNAGREFVTQNLDWLVALFVGVKVLVIAGVGVLLNLNETTVLWLIFGAVIAIGLSVLRGQAAGVGRLIDDVERNGADIDEIENRLSAGSLADSISE